MTEDVTTMDAARRRKRRLLYGGLCFGILTLVLILCGYETAGSITGAVCVTLYVCTIMPRDVLAILMTVLLWAITLLHAIGVVF